MEFEVFDVVIRFCEELLFATPVACPVLLMPLVVRGCGCGFDDFNNNNEEVALLQFATLSIDVWR